MSDTTASSFACVDDGDRDDKQPPTPNYLNDRVSSAGFKAFGRPEFHLDVRVSHPSCSTVGAWPASVVRRMSRTSLRSKRRARRIVERLSHMTRSQCRQAWE